LHLSSTPPLSHLLRNIAHTTAIMKGHHEGPS
jgi:hypothetical protein